MDSFPNSFSEYIDMLAHLRMSASDNKRLCIRRGITLLLFTIAFVALLLFTRELNDLAKRFEVIFLCIGCTIFGIFLIRHLWPITSFGGCLVALFYLIIKALGWVLLVTFTGWIFLIILDYFWQIPAWMTSPSFWLKAISIICAVITIISYLICCYRFILCCLYQKVLLERISLLNTWYETYGHDRIATNTKPC